MKKRIGLLLLILLFPVGSFGQKATPTPVKSEVSVKKVGVCKDGFNKFSLMLNKIDNLIQVQVDLSYPAGVEIRSIAPGPGSKCEVKGQGKDEKLHLGMICVPYLNGGGRVVDWCASSSVTASEFVATSCAINGVLGTCWMTGMKPAVGKRSLR
jgi:hypothetical protein